MEALRFDGGLYGLPLALKTVALFYNTALVETPPRTTDELVAIAERLTDPERGRFGLAYSYGDFYYHSALMNAFGGSVFEGLLLVARSRYLLGICLFIWLYTSLSTFLYFEQAHIVDAAVQGRAARAALADAGLAVDDIDALIVATSTADLTFPSAATMVQDRLGMTEQLLELVP